MLETRLDEYQFPQSLRLERWWIGVRQQLLVVVVCQGGPKDHKNEVSVHADPDSND